MTGDGCNISNYIENKEDPVVFTSEMAKDYTILMPSMLPLHFRLFETLLLRYGYTVKMLTNQSKSAIDTGVRYVHNDACYPAICVIGQFLEALESGEYDTEKTALMYLQTGGGCRASNYVSLLRKALKRCGLPNVPVINLNFTGIKGQPGFKLSVGLVSDMMKALIYGDFLMAIRNQCLVREEHKGDTEEITEKWMSVLNGQFEAGSPSFKTLWETMELIRDDFATIKRGPEVTRVGIVGEIYVKYSPLGNNGLEAFLHSEGAETVVPGVLDFCYYCIYNSVKDRSLYGTNKKTIAAWRIAKYVMERIKIKFNRILTKDGHFFGFSSYSHLSSMAEKTGLVATGLKMGEGWLLPAEMLELCEMGVNNIVCTQPFGCLPNHIIGKGMMKPLREMYPKVNVVAIDYDPGASSINQENRIKLMLANAK